MGKQNNQNFVSIPYTKFIRILKVVAAKFQIPVVVREESYTSKASLLDGDAIPTYGEKGANEVQFSGKRVTRGLYQAKGGTLLNADVNGACNILRKEYPHAFDGITDFSYLWETTRSVGYKDLYPNAKALKGRPEGMGFHDAGSGSRINHFHRKQKRLEYRKLWGKCMYSGKPAQAKPAA